MFHDRAALTAKPGDLNALLPVIEKTIESNGLIKILGFADPRLDPDRAFLNSHRLSSIYHFIRLTALDNPEWARNKLHEQALPHLPGAEMGQVTVEFYAGR